MSDGNCVGDVDSGSVTVGSLDPEADFTLPTYYVLINESISLDGSRGVLDPIGASEFMVFQG